MEVSRTCCLARLKSISHTMPLKDRVCEIDLSLARQHVRLTSTLPSGFVVAEDYCSPKCKQKVFVCICWHLGGVIVFRHKNRNKEYKARRLLLPTESVHVSLKYLANIKLFAGGPFAILVHCSRFPPTWQNGSDQCWKSLLPERQRLPGLDSGYLLPETGSPGGRPEMTISQLPEAYGTL